MSRAILQRSGATALLVMVSVAASTLACSHTVPSVRRVDGLLIDCQPADAEILVNDEYVGTVADYAQKAVRLPVGPVRIEFRREGYFSSYHEMRVVEGLRQTLSVELHRRPF